ncbi:MAG: PEP/pyruvate-binding domain-containing protein [Deltaproteobacteria bacterium]|nr:PEP/pyruvate-binding domain-containing protein [Deltaproteobacteria bacterium]
MTPLATTTYRVLALDLEIREYPILRDVIRKAMREEMFRRGIVREEQFEEEVRVKAQKTQEREGLYDPNQPELAEVWEKRCWRVRDMLTDFYFAHNLPHSIFHSIVADVLGERNKTNLILNFNPETAPWDLLFAQAEEFESGDEATRQRTEHHLQEIIAVLTKGMLSDQLGFVGLARKHFKIADVKEINRCRIGRGKVGGKAAGMNLAWRVLQTPSKGDPVDVGARVKIPDSWFIAADLHYEFVEQNDLFGGLNEKYKDLDQIREDFDKYKGRYEAAKLPESLVKRLDEVLDQVGDAPIVARSSSLLEDNFGTSFAGKYDTHFCPNQGDRRTRMAQLCLALKKIYASALNPDAMAYRKMMGLIDYDERMAILLQKVEGMPWRDHLFPQVAGVGFSHNPYRWTPQIDRKAGFLRLVWGLGTRAVNRVERDHPRLVALSHPTLRPERTARDVRRYSQHMVDTIDLKNNCFATVPFEQLVAHDYPGIRHLASVFEGGEVHPIYMSDPRIPPENYVITLDQILHKCPFVPLMRTILQKLERAWGHPVDIEFTVEIVPGPVPDFIIHLLQCRPQAQGRTTEEVTLPVGIPKDQVVFQSARTVSSGRVRNIQYVVYVDPERYSLVETMTERSRIARTVGKLNRKLEGKAFILVGPGRWGSSNAELGVPVTYADIFNADALVEVPMSIRDEEPEASFGTHFFQDLIESRIYPVAVYPDKGDHFDFDFFRSAPNALAQLVPDEEPMGELVRLIDLAACKQGKLLELTMTDAPQEAVMAYLVPAS